MAHAIVATMYPGIEASELTESQKQTVSALSQLAAGLAGGIAADTSTGIASGAGAGKNAVENNSLSKDKPGIIKRKSRTGWRQRRRQVKSGAR